MAYGSSHREVVAEIRVDHPAYLHSFGMSENHLILVECPLLTHPLRVLLSGRPFIDTYRWMPERGTRLTVIDKDSGAIVRTATTDPCFAFHVVNAFESDDGVMLDLVVYEDPGVVEALSLERLRTGGCHVDGTLTRLAIPFGTTAVSERPLSDVRLELPHFDVKRRAGLPYRHVWGVGQADDVFMSRLQHYDLRTGATAFWDAPTCFPGEPVFVGVPGNDRSDEGVILSVVLDAEAGRSFLLVLDALTLTEHARAWIPHAIPFGFHGGHHPETAAALLPAAAPAL